MWVRYGTNKHHDECFDTCCDMGPYLERDCTLEDSKKKEIWVVCCFACIEHNRNPPNSLSPVLPEAEEEKVNGYQTIVGLNLKKEYSFLWF